MATASNVARGCRCFMSGSQLVGAWQWYSVACLIYGRNCWLAAKYCSSMVTLSYLLESILANIGSLNFGTPRNRRVCVRLRFSAISTAQRLKKWNIWKNNTKKIYSQWNKVLSVNFCKKKKLNPSAWKSAVRGTCVGPAVTLSVGNCSPCETWGSNSCAVQDWSFRRSLEVSTASA